MSYLKTLSDPGIYIIANTINHKIYVGGTSAPIKLRWISHKTKLRHGGHCNYLLQEDYDNYGEKAFVCIVLENIDFDEPIEYIRARETAWMEILCSDANESGYNLRISTLQTEEEVNSSQMKG